MISFFFLRIGDLNIVAQLLKHLDEYLVDDAVLLVYEPADVRSGSTDHLRKLRLDYTLFQTFDLYSVFVINTTVSTCPETPL